MTSARKLVPTTVFPAPQHLVARSPSERRGIPRDRVRLLVADPGGVTHHRFHELPELLRAGDVLVVNNSATLPAELDGRMRVHGQVVVHVATDLRDGRWVVELRTGGDARHPILDARAGESVALPGAVRLRLMAPYPVISSPTRLGNRLWTVRVLGTADLGAELVAHGRPIAYGYLAGRYPLSDYQTVFATHPGSAEMPSAARPFTERLVTRLIGSGVVIAPVTLHTGVSSQEAGEAPQAEWFEVSASTARLVNTMRAGGGRVIAVGTTATRALESAADAAGAIQPRSGWTEVVVTPERGVRAIDGLITGWHDPVASHLLLVEAAVGTDVTQRAYDAAVEHRYLWHEFGDSALLLRPPAAA